MAVLGIVCMILGLGVICLAIYEVKQLNRVDYIESLYTIQMKRNTDEAVKIITNLKNDVKVAKLRETELDDVVKTLEADLKVANEENDKFRKFIERVVAEKDKVVKELNEVKTKETRRRYGTINTLLGAVREIDEEIYDELVGGYEKEDEDEDENEV